MITALLLLAAGANAEFHPPEDVNPRELLVPRNASVLAATVEGIDRLPSAPVKFRFVCEVVLRGWPAPCIPEDPGHPITGWADFEARVHSFHRLLRVDSDKERWKSAAFERVDRAITRFDYTSGEPSRKLLVFTETVSSSDTYPVFKPAGQLKMSDVVLTAGVDPELVRKLYPMPAVRYGITARVSATCRISADGSLFCRAGKVTQPDSAGRDLTENGLDRRFLLATYQVLSTLRLAPKTRDGRDAAGQDLVVAIRWAGTQPQ